MEAITTPPLAMIILKITIIIGTSQVRGLGKHMNISGVNSISYCYPGCDITHITSRVKSIIPENFPGNIILQVGGNDASEVDEKETMSRYATLLNTIADHAPMCIVHASAIPPRNKGSYVNYKIDVVNDFLYQDSLFNEQVSFNERPSYNLSHFLIIFKTCGNSFEISLIIFKSL